jgi:hypothetical protein
MKITPKCLTLLVLIILLTSSCAIKKYALSPDYYSSESKLGLILVTNEIGILQSGQRGAIDVLLTKGNKYKEPLEAVDKKVNPKNKFEKLHMGLLKLKGKNASIVAKKFDESQFEKFAKPDKNKKYFSKDIRALKDKYQVDELMITSISYGLNINYYGMIEAGKGGYSHIVSQIIDLNDNSIIYKSESWGNGKLGKKWDNPPFEPLRIAVASAIQQSIEVERTKY